MTKLNPSRLVGSGRICVAAHCIRHLSFSHSFVIRASSLSDPSFVSISVHSWLEQSSQPFFSVFSAPRRLADQSCCCSALLRWLWRTHRWPHRTPVFGEHH